MMKKKCLFTILAVAFIALADDGFPPTELSVSIPLCVQTSSIDIKTTSIAPGNYPIRSLGAPSTDNARIYAVHGSFKDFAVDLPSSKVNPYELKKDIKGVAQVCTLLDPNTKQRYDVIDVNIEWTEESAGAYAISYQYVPYGAGVSSGSLMKSTILYVIDGHIVGRPSEANDCLGTSSEGHTIDRADLYICGGGFADIPPDCEIQFGSSGYETADKTTEARDKISKAWDKLKKPLTVVMYSHGNVDQFSFSPGVGMTGRRPDLYTPFAEGLMGKIKRLVMESCCTGKAFWNGKRPNLLTELAELLRVRSSSNEYFSDHMVAVCGWQHITFFFAKPRQGRFHRAHSKGDMLVCDFALTLLPLLEK